MNIISDLHLKHFSNAIRKFGVDTVFSRAQKDEYGEPAEPVTFSIRGIFHHTGERHEAFDLESSGRYQRRREYFLLSLDGSGDADDICTIDGKTYTVTGVEDIGMEHKLYEYSLEDLKNV